MATFRIELSSQAYVTTTDERLVTQITQLLAQPEGRWTALDVGANPGTDFIVPAQIVRIQRTSG